MADQTVPQAHVLDDPPPYHHKLLEYGERPYWSPDGEAAAFLTFFVVDPSEPLAPDANFKNMPHDMPQTGAGGLSGHSGVSGAFALILAGLVSTAGLLTVRARRI